MRIKQQQEQQQHCYNDRNKNSNKRTIYTGFDMCITHTHTFISKWHLAFKKKTN